MEKFDLVVIGGSGSYRAEADLKKLWPEITRDRIYVPGEYYEF